MFKADRYENSIVPCHIAISLSIQICCFSFSYLSQIFKDWLLSICATDNVCFWKQHSRSYTTIVSR